MNKIYVIVYTHSNEISDDVFFYSEEDALQYKKTRIAEGYCTNPISAYRVKLLNGLSAFPQPDPKDIDYPSEYPEGYEEMMMQMDEQYNDMVNQEYDEQDYNEQELHPEYVIASTNLMLQETKVFCSNANGEITSYCGLNSIALKHGQEYWEDAFAAVVPLNTDKHKYIHVRTLETERNIHNLFRRIDISDAVII
jgi:hypothetical protein